MHTREEQIEQARRLIEMGISKDLVEVLEKQFPELKDGEDERIRKKMIHFLLYKAGQLLDEETEHKFVAYLEKQKEQKPTMIQWTGNNLKEVIDFTGKSPKFGEWFKSWDEYEDYVHSHDNILKLFCEDESHYEFLVGAWIVKTPDGYNVPSRSKFVQKPAEWSEEDEKMRNKIIGHLYGFIYPNSLYGEDAKECISWLKSLRPQPKQEWSEEDENNFEDLIGYLNDSVHPLDFAVERRFRYRMADWLKSLRNRPIKSDTWKPSKEQIDQIRAEIERRREIHINKVPSIEKCAEDDELLSFLDTLKKEQSL